ncbi:ATP-dependent permease MDL2 [Nadsonia fulvescens var. elongata DSM 6958]|uniref:ATP-dependent permease MDL2 n=1 Tax=Nadsonia fulvescens var. elongata DSM 6958 TaxID=857566 RepID=A0A1E3PLX0_9ASCO|nr:ATP-dependent permease MDL2 [Nadsonia fulvescens var. elongata DSM 6958]
MDFSARLSSSRGSPNATSFNEVKRLLIVGAREKNLFLVFLVLLLITTGITMAIPAVIGRVFDAAMAKRPQSEGQLEHKSKETLIFGLESNTFFWGLGALFIVGSAANFARMMTLKWIGERISARLRSTLFKRAITQDAEFFDANRVGDLISRLSNDVTIVTRTLTTNILVGFRNALQGTAGLAMMCVVNLQLTMIMFVILPPLVVGTFFYGKRMRQISRDLQVSVGALTRVSEERLSNVKTVQCFVGDLPELSRYNSRVRDTYKLGKREAWASSSFFSVTGLVGNYTVLSILILGSQFLMDQVVTIGEMTSYMMYSAYTASAVFGIFTFYSELMKGAGAASRLFELSDHTPRIKITQGSKISYQDMRMPIKFENIDFAYPTRPNFPVFQKLSFEIQPGTSVCIVGPSGTGKSTIASLLLRFYDPSVGRICIGDRDIRSVNLRSLRRHIGIVQQEPVLFSGTIANNIAYGLNHRAVTREEIMIAAERANCGFIYTFSKGLDTLVGPRGALLSGGQKQRIAIARALIKKPGILILDEATSALDVKSEASVNEALKNLTGGCGVSDDKPTVISIAHRLSTIRRCDRVIVLGTHGAVVEDGTFTELYARPDSALTRLVKTTDDSYEQELARKELEHEDFQRKEREVEDVLKELNLEETDRQRDEQDQRDMRPLDL